MWVLVNQSACVCCVLFESTCVCVCVVYVYVCVLLIEPECVGGWIIIRIYSSAFSAPMIRDVMSVWSSVMSKDPSCRSNFPIACNTRYLGGSSSRATLHSHGTLNNNPHPHKLTRFLRILCRETGCSESECCTLTFIKGTINIKVADIHSHHIPHTQSQTALTTHFKKLPHTWNTLTTQCGSQTPWLHSASQSLTTINSRKLSLCTHKRTHARVCTYNTH